MVAGGDLARSARHPTPRPIWARIDRPGRHRAGRDDPALLGGGLIARAILSMTLYQKSRSSLASSMSLSMVPNQVFACEEMT